MTWLRANWFGVTLVIFGMGIGGWVFAQEVGQKTLEQRTASIAKATEQLQKIHIAEDERKKGAEELRKKLCDAGKLPESECD